MQTAGPDAGPNTGVALYRRKIRRILDITAKIYYCYYGVNYSVFCAFANRQTAGRGI